MELALVVVLIQPDANKWQDNRQPSFLKRQFPALSLADNSGVHDDADDSRPEYDDKPRKWCVHRRTR